MCRDSCRSSQTGPRDVQSHQTGTVCVRWRSREGTAALSTWSTSGGPVPNRTKCCCWHVASIRSVSVSVSCPLCLLRSVQCTAGIQELLEVAKSSVPSSMWTLTPVVLKATAGLRLLPGEKAKHLLDQVRGTSSIQFMSAEVLCMSGFTK